MSNLKETVKKYYFLQNYNCAEAIIRGANEYYNFNLHEKEMMMVSGYGAGLQCGLTCGAIISAVSILSLKYVETKAHDSTKITITSQQFVKRFTAKYNSSLCKEIRPQSFNREIRCFNTIATACDILEDIINENDKEF